MLILRLSRLSMVIALCAGLLACSGTDGEVDEPDAGIADDVGDSGDTGVENDADGTNSQEEIGDPEDCDPEHAGTTFVYVDAEYQEEDSDGSCERPRTSLPRAIAQAKQLDSKAVIIGGDSAYYASVTLQEGLSLRGGYNRAPDWSRNTDHRPRILADTDEIDEQRLEEGKDLLLSAVRVVDAQEPTWLTNLTLEAADVDDYESGSSAALVALRSPGLQVIDVRLVAGAAGDGVDGQPGDDGVALADGEGEGGTGHDAKSYPSTYHGYQCTDLFTTEVSFYAADVPPIAEGGSNPHCPDDDTAGGDGGRSDERDADAEHWETRHLPGENSAAGICENPFGQTDNALYDPDNECGGRLFSELWNGFERAYDDQSGRDGLAYEERAEDGAHGQTRGAFRDDRWVLQGHGEDGGDGDGGRGGGGGTGGWARYWSGALDCDLGSGGGGGGAGGCGGEGATGATGGGWSVGLVAEGSPMMRLEGVEIITADGGDGGQGRQPGGAGQPGADGGSHGHVSGTVYTEFHGSDGGDGAPGQDGGYSGHGAGGSSLGIYCPAQDTSLAVDDLSIEVGDHGQTVGGDGPEGSSGNQLGCQIFPADPDDLDDFFPELYSCPDDLDCGCQQESVSADCPSRPCQQLVGCRDNECVYAPIAVGDALCTECVDGDCDDDSVRYCVEGDDDCPDTFCDPAPETTDDDETVFGDQIVDHHIYDCGTCDLGHKTCLEGAYSCTDLEVGGINSEFAECDSTQSGTTYLFVDATYDGSDEEDGSRQAPYASLNVALEEAQRRDNPVLIIGGESTFEETIELRNARSIAGGFEHYPSFYPEPGHRPTISVGDDQIDNQTVVGLDAENIPSSTQLKNLRVEIADVSDHDGVSTTALKAVNASGLHLIDVILEAGDGGHSSDDGGWSIGVQAVDSSDLRLDDVTVMANDGGDGTTGEGGSSVALYCPASDTTIEANELDLNYGNAGTGDSANGLERQNLDCNIE